MAQIKKTAIRPVDLNGVSLMLQEGRVNEARQALEQLLKRNPLNAIALRLMGDIQRAMGESEVALDSYQRSLAVQRSPAAVKGLLAVAEELQRFQVVEQCLRALIRIEPDDGYYYYRLALILKANGATAEEASRCLQQCIAMGYQVKESYYQIGCIAQVSLNPVSYTHLTLPTKRIV